MTEPSPQPTTTRRPHRTRRHRPRAGSLAVLTAVGVLATATGAGAAGSGTWTPTSSLPVPRYAAVATRLNDGRVLVTAGVQSVRLATGFSSTTALTSTEIYNPTTDTWSTTGSLAAGRSRASAVTLADGRVLLAGGQSGVTAVTATEIYNPATGTWSAGPALNRGRTDNLAVRLADGRVLIAGIEGTSTAFATPTGEVFNPVTKKWTKTSATGVTNAAYTSRGVLLPNGRVLTTLGMSKANVTTVDGPTVYDPAANVWSKLPASPVYLGNDPKPVVLPNGHVLFAGGWASGYFGDDPTNVVAELDPATGSWTPRPSTTFTASTVALVSLAGGRVLATGGAADAVYDPATATWSPVATAGGGTQFTLTALADGRALRAGGNGFAWPADGVGPTNAASALLFQP